MNAPSLESTRSSASLDGLRFRLADATVLDTREHDGIVWGDLHGPAITHGQLVASRDGDTLAFALALLSRAGAPAARDGVATIIDDGDAGMRLTGGLDAREAGRAGTLLFVCTGNFYRSRYAEARFEHLAGEAGLDWKAESRGLRAWSQGARGRMSPYALAQLAALDVPLPRRALRPPALATPTDLEAATRVIALDAEEHPPLVEQFLSKFADRFEYWSVPDTDRLDPEIALARIDDLVQSLVHELASV